MSDKPQRQRNMIPTKHQTNRKHSLIFFISLLIFTLIHIFLILHNLSKSIIYSTSSLDEEDLLYVPVEHVHRNKTETKKTSNKFEEYHKATIAYVISVTSCKSENYDQKFIDGAAVLKHSIHLAHNQSKYQYQTIAIIHPQALNCSQNFTKLGYKVLIRETPINVSQIQGQFLRERIVKTGCCQEKELIKLWAYTLVEYPVVVHLDIDTLLLQPLDELFDAMIDGPTPNSKIAIMQHPNKTKAKLPRKINVFFTRDYNIAIPGKEHVGFQGGFFIIRPSQKAFNQYINLLLEGNFQPYLGWEGVYGGYYGAMQIQGIMSYFYDHFHPTTAVELNRCYYNNMVDNPRSIIGEHKGKCRVGGGSVCEDCRVKKMSEIKLVHFTECKKPWDCGVEDGSVDRGGTEMGLCNEFYKRWFWVRRELEKSWNYAVYQENHGNVSRSHWIYHNYFGYCTMQGSKGYKELKIPD